MFTKDVFVRTLSFTPSRVGRMSVQFVPLVLVYGVETC